MTGLIGSMGIPATTGKYMAEYLAGPETYIVRAIFARMMRIQIVIALLIALVAAGLSLVLAESGFHLVFAVLAVGILPQMVTFIPSQANVARENANANTRAALAGLAVYVAAVTLSLLFGWDLLGIACSVVLSRFVELALKTSSVLGWIRRLPPGNLPSLVKQRMFSFSVQGLLLLLVNVVVWDRSDIVFLRMLQGDTRQIAFFSVAFSLVEKLLLAPQSLGYAIGSSQLAEYGRDPKRLLRMTAAAARYVAICGFPLLIGAAALSKTIVGSIYGAPYLPMYRIFAISALFALPRTLLLPVDTLLRATENQRFLVVWNLVCGALNVAMDLLLIPSHGAVGAALANGCSQAIAALGSCVFVLRKFALELAFSFFAKLLLACMAMAAAVLAVAAAISTPWVTLLAGVLSGAAIFILMVRFLGLLARPDRDRLLHLGRHLPFGLRNAFSGIVMFLAPSQAAGS